ncbi:TPA: hypothetical protein ACH3X3_003279 [Trebouxia sp. C0006]
MRPVENRWTKKRKAEEEAAVVPAANVVVQFQSDTGEKAGPQLSVPQDATVKQLNLLLNQLLDNEEKLPYSFFVEEQELASSLGEHLQKNKVSQAKCAQHTVRSLSQTQHLDATNTELH